MRPFFSYYGGKWRSAGRYPAPRPDELVVEPFAGSAGYSVFHEPERALLIDAYEPIVGVWSYLIGATRDEILRLPDLLPDQTVDDLAIPQEAKWLIGYWIHRGTTIPGKRVTSFADLGKTAEWKHDGQVTWNSRARKRIAEQLHKIERWEVRLGQFDSAPDVSAIWFVDPPYQKVSRKYPVKFGDYDRLAQWCRARQGRVVACDQRGADWLPFESLGTFCSTWGSQKSSTKTEEVVWVSAPPGA